MDACTKYGIMQSSLGAVSKLRSVVEEFQMLPIRSLWQPLSWPATAVERKTRQEIVATDTLAYYPMVIGQNEKLQCSHQQVIQKQL